MTSLDIVIVNWNAGQQLRECLESIAVADQGGFELARVIVVDNASIDGSADDLEETAFPLDVIRNKQNRGFGAACNQGASKSQADYLLFLNPDTRLFKESLSKPLAFIAQEGRQDVGIVGIQLVDDDGEVSRSCARFPTPRYFFSTMFGLFLVAPGLFPSHRMMKWDHQESRGVDHVMGAFFLVRRSLYEALEGFDERFFVFFEDLDFSRRAEEAGWRSYYLATAQAYHRGGGTTEQIGSTRLFYTLRSRILYGYQHLGWWTATALMLGTLLLEPFVRVGYAIVKGSKDRLQETVGAYAMLWMSLPRWIINTHSERNPRPSRAGFFKTGGG